MVKLRQSINRSSSKYLNFSEAVIKLKEGERLQRKFWMGKGNYIYLEEGAISRYDKYADKPQIQGIPAKLFIKYQEGIETTMPYLIFRDTCGSFTFGWSPTAADIFAEDWCIMTEEESQID